MTSPLPPLTEAGVHGTWTFTDRYGSRAELEGDFLGMGSSHRPYHKHPFPPYAERGQHCSTCRWMEIRIFQETTGDRRYLILQRGATEVPGEDELITFGWAENGPAVISALTTWSDNGRASVTFVAKRALEQASSFDKDVAAAYRAALSRVIT